MDIESIYVGCGLTHAPEDFRDSVTELKSRLSEEFGFVVYEFVGLEGGTEADVYNWDVKECVGKADAMIGVSDFASTGLGWELSIATQRRIPLLQVAHTEALVTRLQTGAAAVEPHVGFERYDDLVQDVPELFMAHIALVGSTV